MKLNLRKIFPSYEMKLLLLCLYFFSYPAIAQERCTVNLLVAYTDEAAQRAGSDAKIVQEIQEATMQINETFVNSKILHSVRLLRTVKLENFQESGCFQDDLTKFQNDNYVKSLRDKYHADVAAIIIDNQQFCGLAVSDTSVATESTAYCAVEYECMVYNYSLAHQIGHLFGCGHNKFELAPNVGTAFKYGHGLQWDYNAYANFRTIMAMDDAEFCVGQGEYDCSIIPYWSNPEVVYAGVITGTPDVSNNARVITETVPTLSNFKLIPGNYSIEDSVKFADLAIELAIDTLETGNHYSVLDSSSVIFSAGKRIELNPGFVADEGTRFETVLDTLITNCNQ